MRRVILIAIVALALLVAVNTVVTDNETKAAKADIGRVLDYPTATSRFARTAHPPTRRS
jgi:hypothetical protein